MQNYGVSIRGMSLTYSGGDAQPSPRLAWDFNGTVNSYIGSATGTTIGTVPYNPNGKYGQSIVITNTAGAVASNYVSWSTGTIFTTQGTQTIWIKTNTIGTGNQYFLEFGGNSGGLSYVLSLTATNTVNIRVQAVGGVATNISTVTALQVGRWHHIAVVMDGSAHTVYIDGVLSAGPNPSNTTGFVYFSPRIGGSTILPRVLVNGELDDLRLFDTALTSTQVQAIYRAQGMPSRGVYVNQYIKSATGGDTVQDIGGYRIHTFTTVGTSTFTPATGGNVEVLVVAGGGGGGGNAAQSHAGGGGGAGELIYKSNFTVSGAISVAVGPGGAGEIAQTSSSWINSTAGGNSSFGTLTANGGGRGGHQYQNGGAGGSGGGGARGSPPGGTTGGASTATTGFGNAGGGSGSALGGTASAGGGGGAGGPGLYSYNDAISTPGGPGLAYTISGTLVTYAAGGTGGSRYSTANGSSGAANTGSGGSGGSGSSGVLTSGGNGGSGIVIVRYPLPVQMSGAPLFTQLSPSAVASSVGAFSLRAVNGSSARAVQVRNGTTGATQDFYADRRGNLLTAPVVGQSLANWLGGATGYVTTWYDQSGRGNHATQTTAANQPIIQRATKGPGYMINFNGTSQFVTLSASYNFLNGTNLIVNAVALRTATVTQPNYIIGTNSPTVSYQRFFLGFGSDTLISMPVTGAPTAITIPAYNASNEPVTYMTGGLTPSRVLYQNNVLGGTNVDTALLSVPSGYSYSIGYTVGAATYYYKGNLFELLIFTSALDQTQVTQVYQNQLGTYGI